MARRINRATPKADEFCHGKLTRIPQLVAHQTEVKRARMSLNVAAVVVFEIVTLSVRT